MTTLLGDPSADDTTPQGRKARFANLGAVGPDVFYSMADYGGDLQDLENFLIKVAGSFAIREKNCSLNTSEEPELLLLKKSQKF